MKKLFTLLIILSIMGFFITHELYTQENSPQSNDQCYNCHSQLDGKFKAPADMFKADVHNRRGLTCASCHGGDATSDDMDKAMDKAKGFIGVPKGQEVLKVCAKCHNSEYETLMKSVHGESSTGKGIIINNCVTCHGVHNIVPVKSPSSKVNGTNIVRTCASCHSNASYMKTYNPGLEVDQLDKYKTSIHGMRIFKGDTKVANCASCHGYHDILNVKDPNSKVYPTNIPSTCDKCHGDAEYMKVYKIPTNQYEQYKKSVHGIALLQKGDNSAPSCNGCHGDHGAVPPSVSSIAKVCGVCHVLNSQMFDQSPHRDAFEKKDLGECTVCHSNHDIKTPSDTMLGIGKGSVCIKCHTSPEDKGYQAAFEMASMIDSLNRDVTLGNEAIQEAEQKGMDVSDAKFSYNDIKKVLITTRTITHYSNLQKFVESISEGFKITNKAKTAGEEAVKDYYFRRYGLGISTILITILILALYLKLRKIEKRT